MRYFPHPQIAITAPHCSSLMRGPQVIGFSDFPHSKQNGLDRDVISAQNGHILCDRNSWRYVFIAKHFLSGSVMKPSNARTRMRKGCMGSTAQIPRFPVFAAQISGAKVMARDTWSNTTALRVANPSHLRPLCDSPTMTRQRR